MTFGHQVFMWRGEPIADIRAWARARGEQMVQYIEHRRELLFGPPWVVVTETPGEMPESFWNGLPSTSDRWYVETGKEQP